MTLEVQYNLLRYFRDYFRCASEPTQSIHAGATHFYRLTKAKILRWPSMKYKLAMLAVVTEIAVLITGHVAE